MHNCRFFELRWKKPMKMMNSIIMTGFGRISAACGCHTGRRRKNNEDNFFFAGRYMASDNNGLGSILEKSFSLKKDRFFAVFDGMGGGEYGEIASYIAAKATEQYLNAEEAANLASKKDYLEKMCTHVNDRIFKETLRLNAEMMGSTLAGLYFTGSHEQRGISGFGFRARYLSFRTFVKCDIFRFFIPLPSAENAIFLTHSTSAFQYL